MYWTYNTKTKQPNIYGSLKALSDDLAIPLNKLYYSFSQLKKTDITMGEIRVCKIKPVTKPHQNVVK